MTRVAIFLISLSLLFIKGECNLIAIAQELPTPPAFEELQPTPDPVEIPTELGEVAPPPTQSQESKLTQEAVDSPAELDVITYKSETGPPPKCHEVPLLISKCVPGICIEKSPFGIIHRQIVSYDQTQNVCLFKERTPGFGGINCSFKANNLDSIDQLYTKKFIARFDKNITLSEQESLNIKQINEESCTFLTDQEASNDPIPLELLQSSGTSGNNMVKTKDIEASSSDSAISESNNTNLHDTKNTTTNVTESPADINDPDSNNESNAPVEDAAMLVDDDVDVFKFKSLMFTTGEINLLNQALDAYKTGSTFSIGGDDTDDEDLSQLRFFFLKSLIYYTPDQWSLWLENSLETEKITDTSNSSGLSIEEIKSDSVTLIWQTPNLDKISPDWKRFLISDLNNRYRHEKYDIVIRSDEQSIAEVKFRLRPNQTFNVNKMQIIEGKIR